MSADESDPTSQKFSFLFRQEILLMFGFAVLFYGEYTQLILFWFIDCVVIRGVCHISNIFDMHGLEA
jgi:hypothetical protein